MNASDFDPNDMNLNAKRVLTTGRVGFLGSRLCAALRDQGDEVLCIDSYFTGRRGNLRHILNNFRFEAAIRLTRSKSELVKCPMPQDDPVQRQPDITRAREQLGWAPQAALEDGLKATIAYFQQTAVAMKEL
ncbi:NAD-dependent epimerase/dehydratase family protein [Ruegeria sp. HKCCA5763]|uniref:NAD-dependent epimerase/dehydratase family protein n=1 Tax=Ruegeria sp. HKCCA5763 TaxID=2682987 RepID=UPI001488C197|nr:NAD-dependent epimerase/dehydratase family protein [Ruegeria sp. HKCCA5763]